jgi:hypothetical protein
MTLPNGRKVSLYKVSLEDDTFHEQSFYLQSLLPFFIDGASPIEPSPFWRYFLIVDSESRDLLAFTTLYEAHLSAVKYRARISQVLVVPAY